MKGIRTSYDDSSSSCWGEGQNIYTVQTLVLDFVVAKNRFNFQQTLSTYCYSSQIYEHVFQHCVTFFGCMGQEN